MKLNNRGWGLRVMLVCIIVLMIALVIIAALASKLFGELGLLPNNPPTEVINPSKNTYQDLENSVIESAKKYHDKYYSDMLDSEKISVSIKTLKKYEMLKPIYDIKDTDKECSGYAIFTLKDNKLDYKAYIKCEKYTTKDYLEHMDI